MKEHKNDSDIWGVSRFINEIERGDIAFVWLTKYKGKETRGIYAMAKITGLPGENPEQIRRKFAWEAQYWTDQKAKERRRRLTNLELCYTKLITDKSISKDELETTGLGNLLILRMSQRSIYKLTEEEGQKIKRMIELR